MVPERMVWYGTYHWYHQGYPLPSTSMWYYTFYPVVISKRRMKPFLYAVTLLPLAYAQSPQTGFCDGCFCIPLENETCPFALEPNMNFSSFLDNLLEFKLENPVSLDCNPYKSTNDSSTVCDLTPTPLTDGGACVVEFNEPSNGEVCPFNWTYSLRTFKGSVQEAQAQGFHVTHGGPCGACSSLQDLYVYMEKGEAVREEATTCGIRGISSVEEGIECYRAFGFTESCAAIWHYNTLNTQGACLDLCAEFYLFKRPNNGPPPLCVIDKCIECDEVQSGPIFQKYAGRTRRSSGLLSSIARTCSELSSVVQVDPCPLVELDNDTSGVQARFVVAPLATLLVFLFWFC